MTTFRSLLTIGILGSLLAVPSPLLAGSFSYSSSAITIGGSDSTRYHVYSGSIKSHQLHRSFDRRHDFDRRHYRSHDFRQFDRYYSRDLDRRHFRDFDRHHLRSHRYHSYDPRFDGYRQREFNRRNYIYRPHTPFYRYDRGYLNYRVCYRSGSALVCLQGD